MRSPLVSVVLLVGCTASAGAPEPRRTTQKPLTVAEPEPIATTESDRRPAPTARYAASPITDLAQRITDLVIAVNDGNPPPRGTLPLERERPVSELLRGEEKAPRSADLDFFAFALELDIVLVADDGQSPRPVGDGPNDGGIRVVLFLSRTGLKLASLELTGPDRVRPVDRWLAGAAEAGAEVFAGVRERRVGSMLFGESERAVIGDDRVFKEISDELPSAKELARADELARNHATILGFDFDDVFVIARDRRGTFWGFALQVESDDGRFVLDTGPLVRVQRMDPERGF